MVLFILFLLLAALGLFWLILKMPSQKSAVFLINGGPFIVIAVGVLLTFFRRGAIGVPLMLLGLSWWRRSRSKRPLNYSGKRKSTVRSANLEMELDHDTGEMDGWVLTGSMKGTRLSSLSETEILALYQEISADADSAALLESFLDRYHPDWQQRYDHSSSKKRNGTSGFDSMTRKEAYRNTGAGTGCITGRDPPGLAATCESGSSRQRRLSISDRQD